MTMSSMTGTTITAASISNNIQVLMRIGVRRDSPGTVQLEMIGLSVAMLSTTMTDMLRDYYWTSA